MSGPSGEFVGDIDSEGKRLLEEQIAAEVVAFSEQITNLLRNDEDLNKIGYIPIKNPEVDLFENSRDGILLCKIVNAIRPGSIPEKLIKMTVKLENLNTPGSKDAWEINANNTNALNAAIKMGCKIVNIGSEDIVGGDRGLILAVVWQLIRYYLMKSVNLMSHPELIRLLEPGEKIDKLLNMRAEDIIKRWFNYHLKRAGPDENGEIRKINNFGKDLKDSSKWVILFQQIAPNEAEEADIDEVMETADLYERANKLLDVAEELECRQFTTANDIVKGYERLNLAFTATIFNTHIGITLPTEAEIARLYQELEDLKLKGVDCSKKLEELEKHVAELEAEKAQILSEVESFESRKMEIDEKLRTREEEITKSLAEKAAEIARLQLILAEKDAELIAKLNELEEATASFHEIEESTNEKIQTNKDSIASFEGQIADMEQAVQELRDLVDGKGQSMDDMQAQLKEKEEDILVKKAVIEGHYAAASDIYGKHADTLKIELPQPEDENEKDKDRLNRLIESNTILIKKYEQLLSDKRGDFKRHQDEEKRQLDELNREVGDFLGEGQSSAEDAVANMKRLLELMIEKCKKQAQHIQTQQVTIEKKNQINTVMGNKICDIAQNQRDVKKSSRWKRK